MKTHSFCYFILPLSAYFQLFGIHSGVTDELNEIHIPNKTQDVFTLDSKTIAGQAGGSFLNSYKIINKWMCVYYI